jgi:hypothetical protein
VAVANKHVEITRKGPGFAPIAKLLHDLSETSATVGYQGSTGSAKAGDSELPVAVLAAVHEFGVPDRGIVARPFMHRGVDRASETLPALAVDAIGKLVAERSTASNAMSRVSEHVADAVKSELDSAEAWSGSPLVDNDGSLRDGLTYAVRVRGNIVGGEIQP